MNSERGKDEHLKKQLQQELEETVFTEELKRATICRIQASKSSSFWGRELTIPLPVIALAMAILLAVPVIGWRQAAALEIKPPKTVMEPQERMIVSGAGVFYESQLQKEED